MSTECFRESEHGVHSWSGWKLFSFPSRVAQKREDAVSKEVTRKLSEADNRKMSRKEKDERFDSLFEVFVIIKNGDTVYKISFRFLLRERRCWSCLRYTLEL